MCAARSSIVAGLPPELGRGAAAGGRRPGRPHAPNPLGEACQGYWTPETVRRPERRLAWLHRQLPAVDRLANPAAGGGRGASLNGPSFQVAKFQTPQPVPARVDYRRDRC